MLLLLVVGLVAAKSAAQAWLRGEGFREWAISQIAPAMRAEVEVSEFSWQGSELYVDRFIARGLEDAGFSSVEAMGFRARSGGIRNGAYQIPEVSANRLHLAFSDERASARGGRNPVVETSGATGPSLPAWLRRWLPDRVEIEAIRIDQIGARVKDPDGSVPFELAGATATARPDFETGLWEIDAHGGRIALPNRDNLQLDELRLRWRANDLFIDRCRVRAYDQGQISGSGEIDLSDGGGFDLALEFSSIPLAELLEDPWRERISGSIHGPVTMSGVPGSFRYEGQLRLSDGVLRSLPAQTMIANYTRNEQFKHLALNEARARFVHEGDLVSLSDIVLQSDGLIRVEGEIEVRGSQLEGRLQVGVPPGTLSWIPGAERRVFTEERGGFLWTPVQLGGTTDAPREDLTSRLVAAAGEAVLKDLPSEVLEELTRRLPIPEGGDAPSATEQLLEQAKPLLDLITPFLSRP
jgi:hypothetical protein